VKVEWSADATRDIAEIARFIGHSSERRAMTVVDRLETAARSLESHPGRGRVVPELSRLGIDRWRELIVPPWRIGYRPMGRTVRSYAVLDGRRNLEDLLLERLLRTADPEGTG